jgi:hypothetical protein
LNLYTHPIWSASREFLALSAPVSGRFAHVNTSPGALVVGIVVTIVLTILRTRFTWFPFHPLGFALAPTWALMVFWFPFLIAWCIRSLVLRYGGLKIYRQLTPLMLGLIIGEFSSAVFWSVLNMTVHASAPDFPWP